jgi:hypothetical protein
MGNCCKLVRGGRRSKDSAEHPDWNGHAHVISTNGGSHASPVYSAKKRKKSSNGSVPTAAGRDFSVAASGGGGSPLTVNGGHYRPKSISDSKHPLVDSGNNVDVWGNGGTPIRSADSYENKLEENIPHIADFYPEDNSTVPADNPRISTLFLPKASKSNLIKSNLPFCMPR